MHCSVLQYCDSVSHLVCIFVPQEPEVLRLDHTHFPGSSPESELEEPDFSPSDDSFCFFFVDARHCLGTPWEISGDPELPGEMVPSTVRLGDGDGKKGGHGNGNGEMLVLECSFLDPKIPNRFHKIPRISGEESISGRILMEDPRKIHLAEL